MGEPRTILLADDDPLLQSAVKRVTKRLGHQLVQTMRGRDVGALAAKHRPDLIILDLGFADADGRDVLSRLKSNEDTHDIPVLVWSGRVDEDSKRVALELGAEDYIEKHDAQTLLRKVDRVLLNCPGPRLSRTRLVTAEKLEAASSHRTGKGSA